MGNTADEKLRDILNGKLNIVQNRKRSESDNEDDYNDDENKMPEENGDQTCDTSEPD